MTTSITLELAESINDLVLSGAVVRIDEAQPVQRRALERTIAALGAYLDGAPDPGDLSALALRQLAVYRFALDQGMTLAELAEVANALATAERETTR